MINGQLWNQVNNFPTPNVLAQVEVVKHMKKIFLEENLVNNLPEKSSRGEEEGVKKVLESLTGRTNWTEANILEAKAKIEEFCLQP